MKEKFEDRYETIETIAGSGAIVYKALDKSFDRIVAVKTPDDKSLANERRLSQFIEEANLLAKFDHPNIITAYNFHEIGEFDQKCYLVCPWIESSLDDVITKENLSSAAVFDIFFKVLEGVRALHNEGIIHRDLKPENILLSQDRQQVKIADLGIASSLDNNQTLDPSALSPKYQAPEVLDQNKKINRRTDIYSLGMMAYEMLLGQQRFEAAFPEIYQNQDAVLGTSMRWMNWHKDDSRKATPLKDLVAEIAPELSAIIERMMSKDTGIRYGDVDSVTADLKEHLGNNTMSLPYATISSKDALPKPPLLRRKSFYISAILSLLLLFVLIYFLFVKKGPLELRALDEEVIMNALRARAISFQLDVEGASEQYPPAEVDRAEGYAAKKKRDFKLTADEFISAKNQFQESITTYLDRRINQVESISREASSVGASDYESFALGGISLSAAKESIEKLSYRQSGLDLDLALSHFREALSLGLLKEIEALIVKVSEYGIKPDNALFISAIEKKRLGEEAIEAKTFDISVKNLTLSRETLLQLVDLSERPRLAKVGSTTAQIDQALQLCSKYADNCQRDWYSSEVYQEILLKPFELDLHEVTIKQYLDFVVATGYQTDAERLGYSNRVVLGKSARVSGLDWSTNFEEEGVPANYSSLPVVNVSYNDAVKYCAHVGRRLPTAAEWEYVARTHNEEFRVYPWGDSWLDNHAIWFGSEDQGRVEAGKQPKGATEQGHTHLSGNVWEWTSTKYADGFLLKGGSWAENNPANLRSAAAIAASPEESSDDYGFRCAISKDIW